MKEIELSDNFDYKKIIGKFIVDFKALKEIIYNGLSEVISNASGSIVMILFNYQAFMIRYL